MVAQDQRLQAKIHLRLYLGEYCPFQGRINMQCWDDPMVMPTEKVVPQSYPVAYLVLVIGNDYPAWHSDALNNVFLEYQEAIAYIQSVKDRFKKISVELQKIVDLGEVELEIPEPSVKRTTTQEALVFHKKAAAIWHERLEALMPTLDLSDNEKQLVLKRCRSSRGISSIYNFGFPTGQNLQIQKVEIKPNSKLYNLLCR